LLNVWDIYTINAVVSAKSGHPEIGVGEVRFNSSAVPQL